MSVLFLLQAAATHTAADTLDLRKSTEELVEKIATTPADQLFSEFLNQALAFGLKVLAALLILVVAATAWLRATSRWSTTPSCSRRPRA